MKQNKGTIQAYRDYKAISQSDLFNCKDGIKAFLKYKKEQHNKDLGIEPTPEYFIFGSYLDDMLFVENGIEDYIITSTPKPTAMAETLVDLYIQAGYTEYNEEYALDIANEAGLWASTKDIKKRLDLVSTSNIVSYIREQLEAKVKGKKLIFSDDALKCTEITDMLWNNPDTAWLFEKSTDLVEIKYQYPIYWDVHSVPKKGLLDILVINHETKTISIYDLKTSSDASKFANSYYEYGYFLQKYWYTEGIKAMINKGLLPDYTITFKFLVVDRKHDFPYIYIPQTEYKGYSMITNTGKYIPPLSQLMETLERANNGQIEEQAEIVIF